jgi:hypothetical protein
VRIRLLKGHSRNKITSPLNVRVVAEQEGAVQDSFPGAVRHYRRQPCLFPTFYGPRAVML